MLITARNKVGCLQRRGCLALATSQDLQTWKVHPPFWEPYIAHTLECPERFHIGVQEYLAFSTYSEINVTHYRLMQETSKIASPGLIDQIDTHFFYAAKGLSDDTRRITFGWIPEVSGDTDEGDVMWGGHLGIPHTLTPGNDGNLAVYYPESYQKFIGIAIDFRQIHTFGDWEATPEVFRGSSSGGTAYTLFERQAQEFYMTFSLALEEGTHTAGLILNAESDISRGYCLEFEKVSQSLRLFKYRPRDDHLVKRKILVQRPMPFPVADVFVELFYDKGLLTVFINKSAAMSARLYETGPNFGLFVQSGQARFHGLAVHALKGLS
jgi:beta-fructofuranosidase